PAKSSPPAPWLTETLRCHRRELWTAAKRWRKSHVDSDLSSYKSLLSKFSLEVTSAKSSYYREKFKSSSFDPCKIFTIFSSLLNPPPPPPFSSLTLEDFITFFEEKVAAIRQSFSSVPTPPTNVHSPTSNSLTSFSPLSTNEILQLLTSSNPTTCPLDPSALFQTIARDLLPFISVIINNSLSSGYVPAAFKTARVEPILKKATLDTSSITNYRQALCDWLFLEMVSVLSGWTVLSDSSFVTYEGFDPFFRWKLP
ncbi:hypothetical protein P4O66_019125, partial [Electrophorus voltai]